MGPVRQPEPISSWGWADRRDRGAPSAPYYGVSRTPAAPRSPRGHRRPADSLTAAHMQSSPARRLRAARQRHRRGVRREPYRPTTSMACSRSTNTNKRRPQRPLDPTSLRRPQVVGGRGRNLVGGWARGWVRRAVGSSDQSVGPAKWKPWAQSSAFSGEPVELPMGRT